MTAERPAGAVQDGAEDRVEADVDKLELADALNAVMNARSVADSQLFRAESESRQHLLAAEQGVEIAKTQAAAVQIEMSTLAANLATLERDGVLSMYVDRRQTEVLAESRTLYVNEGAAKQ